VLMGLMFLRFFDASKIFRIDSDTSKERITAASPVSTAVMSSAPGSSIGNDPKMNNGNREQMAELLGSDDNKDLEVTEVKDYRPLHPRGDGMPMEVRDQQCPYDEDYLKFIKRRLRRLRNGDDLPWPQASSVLLEIHHKHCFALFSCLFSISISCPFMLSLRTSLLLRCAFHLCTYNYHK